LLVNFLRLFRLILCRVETRQLNLCRLLRNRRGRLSWRVSTRQRISRKRRRKFTSNCKRKIPIPSSPPWHPRNCRNSSRS